jgi:hypothetical protein
LTHHDERILRYIEVNPDVRSRYVAGIFGVEQSQVDTLRRRHGAFNARKKAAIARKMKPADLDDAILAAVYKRGLVDTVLDDGA